MVSSAKCYCKFGTFNLGNLETGKYYPLSPLLFLLFWWHLFGIIKKVIHNIPLPFLFTMNLSSLSLYIKILKHIFHNAYLFCWLIRILWLESDCRPTVSDFDLVGATGHCGLRHLLNKHLARLPHTQPNPTYLIAKENKPTNQSSILVRSYYTLLLQTTYKLNPNGRFVFMFWRRDFGPRNLHFKLKWSLIDWIWNSMYWGQNLYKETHLAFTCH